MSKARKATPLAMPEVATNFTHGMVAAGLLAAIQERWGPAQGKPSGRKVARLALQGGAALAAGVATAQSLRRRDYASALVALAGGAIGIAAAELLLTSTPRPLSQESENG